MWRKSASWSFQRQDAAHQKARENQDLMDQDKLADLIRRYPDKARELLGS